MGQGSGETLSWFVGREGSSPAAECGYFKGKRTRDGFTMRVVAAAICSLVLSAGQAYADANLPDLGPTVISVFPLGARQAETLDVQISGRNLDDTRDITFARQDIQAKVLSSDFFSVKARVSVGAKVPLGLHDYRLRTSRGTHVGVFQVGSLPRENEIEPNDDLKHAQAITLPLMVDGIVEADDYDVFRFFVFCRVDRFQNLALGGVLLGHSTSEIC